MSRARAYIPWLLVAALCGPALVAADARTGSVPEILVSRQLLEAHGLEVGQVVSLAPDADGRGAREFRVAGSYEPLPDPWRLTAERHEVRLHLPDLLALVADPTDPQALETVDAINVALADPAAAAVTARELAPRMPGLAVMPTAAAADDAASPFVALERFHLAIAIVTVLGSSAFLLALMVMRVEERRETAGILRLIGLTRRRILLEVLLEGLLIALAGALFGLAVAALTEGVVNRFFQFHYDTALVFVRVTPEIAGRCIAVAVPLGVLAGLVASWTLLRRDIAALIRR